MGRAATCLERRVERWQSYRADRRQPGVGKTRLADDFLHWVASQGGIVLRGRGYDAHAGAPFGAVIDALRSATTAPGVAGVDPEWLGEIARVLPEIRRRFAGLPEASPAIGAADG